MFLFNTLTKKISFGTFVFQTVVYNTMRYITLKIDFRNTTFKRLCMCYDSYRVITNKPTAAMSNARH